MIDLAPPGGTPIANPPDKNSRSPRPEDGKRNPAANDSGTDAAGSPTGGEFVALFNGFFDSFRRQVLECYGKRCDEMIARAEEKVAGRSPGFGLRAIGPANALSVLDLVEMMIGQASVFKRRRLRQAALGAVSELYNTRYDALERFGVVDRVEQFYYRLKK